MTLKAELTGAVVLKALRRHRSELARFSVRTIALFGSFAKNAQTDSSDLDFVVEFSAPTYHNFAALEQFLEQLFGRRIVILTPAGVASIRIPHVAEDINQSLVHV